MKSSMHTIISRSKKTMPQNKFAYQLHCAVTKPIFILNLVMITKYIQVLEHVVNALQGKIEI